MAENIIEIKGVSKSFGENIVLENINLNVRNGEFLTLLGPSGCGKTTLLRLISGFENPDQGKIYIKGQEMTGLPPNKRQVHTVFQSYALFPHMTVFDNVAFGLRCQRIPRTEIKTRVEEALNTVKLSKFAYRKPTQLSGGQQQRVAIARAVVNRPLVLLLDEPLSSLDYRLRKNMQLELKQMQRKIGIAFIFVTHDQEEALSMSDRVVVMHEGAIEQIGTPREVYEKPQNLTVAKFIGEVNIFDTEIITADENNITVNIEGNSHVYKNRNGFKVGEKVHVLIRPEDTRVWSPAEIEDTTNLLPGVVEEVIYKGTTVDLMVRLKNNKLIASTQFFDEDDDKLEYNIGESVLVNWLPGWEVILPHDQG